MRRSVPLQINQFSGGLNTEFNPLEVDPNTSSDELNMELQRDGSRAKRLGFSYEDNFSIINSGVVNDPTNPLATSIFRWENAGGDADFALTVVQIGPSIHIFNAPTGFSETIGDYSSKMDFAVIDGKLVVASNRKTVRVYTYNRLTNTITGEDVTLYVRDFWGVHAELDGKDLDDSQNSNYRPLTSNDAHIYNLRNQTFAAPRKIGNGEQYADVIGRFVGASGNTNGAFPANSDNVTKYLYPDPEDVDDRLGKRAWVDEMYNNPEGLTQAPQGYFVIDALERGNSRLSEVQKLNNTHPFDPVEGSGLGYEVNSLPWDATPGGPQVVAEYAGRVCYGGFCGDTIDGDDRSPKLCSYILFSRVIRDSTELGQCFQRADPTNEDDSVLVEDDGGYVRIDGAYGISKMLSIGSALFVIARNGVWRVTGSDEATFTATSIQVQKITDRGCLSRDSVVQVKNSFYYWSEDAIYYISQNELGAWNAQNITRQKLETLYATIDNETKSLVSGCFDSLERKIRWVYTSEVNTAGSSKELVYHLDYEAFTINSIPVTSGNMPLVTAVGETTPYSSGIVDVGITTSSGVAVTTSSGEDVTTSAIRTKSVAKEVIYLVISAITPTIQYSFGRYSSQEMYDWGDAVSGVGYSAYLVVGSVTGGEPRLKKQVPYLNTFFRKTEGPFDESLSPTFQSSCLLSSQWNWTGNTDSNKWSTPRQAYRISRLYFPEPTDDTYTSGDTIITTRNKIRGMGHSVAFRFEAEAGKNLHIYGWSFDLQANGTE